MGICQSRTAAVGGEGDARRNHVSMGTGGGTDNSGGAFAVGRNEGLDSSRSCGNSTHSGSVLCLEEVKSECDELQVQVVRFEVPLGKPIEEVYDGVHDGKILGKGILGVVRRITHRATGVKYAVKCLKLKKIKTEEGLRQLREEIYIMCQLDHPNVVRLEEVFESKTEIYLVQELCSGGDLFDRLNKQPDVHYTEAQCARLVKQMLSALRYIHSKGIVHRDLKLENFLFSGPDPDSDLKMIDFGLSKHFKLGEVHHEAVGSPYTVAPEVICGCYDERCDVWAIGVLTFLLLSGDAPFGGCYYGEDLMEVRQNILERRFEFEPPEVWDTVSHQARDFINRLLVSDPRCRPTAQEAQESAWLQWAEEDRDGEETAINPNVVQALIHFKEYSAIQKLLREVLSFMMLPNQIAGLRREFQKLDTDGSGEISLSGLKYVLLQNRDAGSHLTEREVEDIFNSMRTRKTETRVHYHEFLAAGLSQCKVDECNLKLAFDRLDADRKGYLTFSDVMELMDKDASDCEDAMRQMWSDSVRACNCDQSRITFADFLLLMSKAADGESEGVGVRGCPLGVIQESIEAVGGGADVDIATTDYGRKTVDVTMGVSSRQVAEIIRETEPVAMLTSPQSPKLGADGGLTPSDGDGPCADCPIKAVQAQLRFSVLEACKRFEEQQVNRACNEQASNLRITKEGGAQLSGAGLTMHHGLAKELSVEELRHLVNETQKELRSLVDDLSKRSGRGRRNRVVSDLSEMFNSLPPPKASLNIRHNFQEEKIDPNIVAQHALSSEEQRTEGFRNFRPTADPFADLESVHGRTMLVRGSSNGF